MTTLVTTHGQKLTVHPNHIDPNKPTPTVKGTNVPPGFFEKRGFDPASIPEADIRVFIGYASGKALSISVNGEKVTDVASSLSVAGAKPISAPLPPGLGAVGC